MAAVDGQDLDLNDTAKIDPAFLNIEYPAGAAGCALSHLSVYTKIIADGLDKALVLEDDVILPADLVSLADAVAEQFTGAEIALLNFDSPEPVRMSSEAYTPSGRTTARAADRHFSATEFGRLHNHARGVRTYG